MADIHSDKSRQQDAMREVIEAWEQNLEDEAQLEISAKEIESGSVMNAVDKANTSFERLRLAVIAGKALLAQSTPLAEHLQDAPRTLRNLFEVADPNDPKRTVKVVYASVAMCIEREANQLRTLTPSSTALPFHVPPERFNEAKARVLCDWPIGLFRVMDDPDPHKPCYLICPDGAAVGFSHHDGEGVDKARVQFIADACNAALSATTFASGDVFLCRASGEGSQDFRICPDEAAVYAFYEEMTGRDQDGTLDSITKSFHDTDYWGCEGRAFSLDLYMAKFEVWKVQASELCERSDISGSHQPKGDSNA